jgi:hypothetical protein
MKKILFYMLYLIFFNILSVILKINSTKSTIIFKAHKNRNHKKGRLSGGGSGQVTDCLLLLSAAIAGVSTNGGEVAPARLDALFELADKQRGASLSLPGVRTSSPVGLSLKV